MRETYKRYKQVAILMVVTALLGCLQFEVYDKPYKPEPPTTTKYDADVEGILGPEGASPTTIKLRSMTTTLKQVITTKPPTTTSTTQLPFNFTKTIIQTTTTTQPACGMRITKSQQDEMLNIRPKRGQSPVYQGGYFHAKEEILEILGLRKNKYTEAPSRGIKDFYKQVDTEPETYCFRQYYDDGYYFLLNRTPDMQGRKRWGWNDEECKKSVLKVRKL